VAAGLAPLLAWEIFSLLYYGFPFPNTAYAKLGAGFGRLELTGRGVEYFANSAAADPVTLAAIGAGAIAPLVGRASPRGRAALVSAGIALHLLYVLSIGGDFMSGRFFTAPLLPAVALLARRDPGPRAVLAVAGCLAALWLVAPSYSPFARGARLSTVGDFQASIDDNGIADERSVYFPVASLRSAPPGGLWPSPGSGVQAIAARESWTADYWIPGLRRLGILDPVETWPPRPSPGRPLAPVVVRYAVGYIGFYAGPTLHILDLNALADPLLARLPALNPDPLTLTFLPRLATRGWRIGHFVRRIPAGYLETLATGENRIRDARLAEYYDRLRLITRGPLLAPGRLAAIWRMNTGAYDHLLAAGPGGAARDARRPSERLATRDPRGPARRAAARDACDPAQRFAARGLAVSHGGRRPTIAR
jgi:arabinofuranosyltransferase